MPEGTIVSNVEAKVGDRGSLARASGTSAIVIGHSDDGSKSRIRLPSGTRKTVLGSCRGMIGVVAGGQRTDKPILKAGNVFYKNIAKKKKWPRVRGVATDRATASTSCNAVPNPPSATASPPSPELELQ